MRVLTEMDEVMIARRVYTLQVAWVIYDVFYVAHRHR